jgi:hypothetical protein
MKVPRTISKPSYVFGLPQTDFRLLLAWFTGTFILNNLLQTFGVPLKLFGWAFIALSTWALFLYLRYGAKQNYPGFLSSKISYLFFQPKKISASKRPAEKESNRESPSGTRDLRVF